MRPLTLLLVFACGQAAYGQSTLLIEAHFPGGSSQVMAETVLVSLEQLLLGTEGVRRERGLALDGRCLIRLDLTKDADALLIHTTVQNRIAVAKSVLPPGCTTEILPQADSDLMLITLEPAPDMSLADVSQLVKKTIWPPLAKVPGVANIRIIGATEEQVRITLNPDRLRAYGLGAGDVVAALHQASGNKVDNLSVQGNKLTIKKKAATLQDLERTAIVLQKDIYLRDVASVKVADEMQEIAGIFVRRGDTSSMRRTVFILVQMSPGKLNLLAKKGLDKALKELRNKLPAGVLCESQLLHADDTTVVMRLPDGLEMQRREEKALAVVKALRELPQVGKVCWIVQPDDGEVIFYVMADAGKKVELHKSLRAQLAKLEAASSRVGGLYSPLLPWPGEGAQFVAYLRGKDQEKLQQTAELLRKRLTGMPGFVDLDHFPRMRPEVSVEIDGKKLIALGLSRADIVTALNFDKQTIPGWPWSVTLVCDGPKRTVEQLSAVKVGPAGGNPVVLLRDVAVIRQSLAPSGILHEAGRSCVIVFGNLEGRTLDEARADIRRIMQELAVKGVEVEVE
jgi:multidrug efflux pump subunit AcrB